jgi:long-subunit acyl-CoA synthetase (AMP-forming)
MPKKPPAPETTEDSALVSAAKVIGKAAGKIAAIVTPDAKPATKSQKVPKLVKKDKHRLPRKQKKALAKKSTPAA